MRNVIIAWELHMLQGDQGLANLITGIADAYSDSIPVVFITAPC